MKKARGLIEFLVFFILVAVIVAVGMRLTLNQMEEQRVNNEYAKQEQPSPEVTEVDQEYSDSYDSSESENQDFEENNDYQQQKWEEVNPSDEE